MKIRLKILKEIINEVLARQLNEEFISHKGDELSLVEPMTLPLKNSMQRHSFGAGDTFTYLGSDGTFHYVKSKDGNEYTVPLIWLKNKFVKKNPARRSASDIRGVLRR